MKYLFTSLLLIATYISFGQLYIDVTTLGASTGSSDNGPYIQAAIDSVSNNGGGEVIINGGSFKSNTIILKSNVTLRVTSGSTLLALATNTFPDLPYNTYHRRRHHRWQWHSICLAGSIRKIPSFWPEISWSGFPADR